VLNSFEVANIRCSGCANTIEKALTKAGFLEVSVDLSCMPRKVTAVIEDDEKQEEFRKVLRKLGYPLNNEKIGFTDGMGLQTKSFVSCSIGKLTQ